MENLTPAREWIMSKQRRAAGGDRSAVESADALDLRALVERYLDGVTLIVDGKVQYANETLGQMSGYTAEEALGRPMWDFIVPEDRERGLERLITLAGGGPATISEYRLLRKDGTTRPVEVLSRLIDYEGKPALLSLIRDVTEHKRALERLRESEERYRVLYEDNPSMYFTVDDGGIVLSVNKFGAEQLGYEPHELVGHDVLEVFREDDREAMRRQLAECLSNASEVENWELRKVRKDGTVIWVSERARVLRNADGSSTLLIVCEDVTERKRVEEERRALEEQVRHAQKLKSLGVMAGGVAHDFNNLLVGILGNASLALTRLDPDSAARADIESLEKAADRAADLCRQLLAYSGRGRFVVQPADMSELVTDLGDLLEFTVPRKGTLRYDLADDLPPIEADVAQVRQVIMNLVANAAEAIGEREGRIAIRTSTIEFEEPLEHATAGTISAGRYVCLEIADGGCGMDRQTLEKMFDPFFTTKFTGRGLGLAAVLGIVRGHDGALQVDSESGKGTRVRVLFRAGDLTLDRPAEREPAASSGADSGTILVVDDEELVRSVATQALELSGFDVLTAVNGEEAVRAIEERGDEIDLVLLDLTMPGLGGQETFGILKERRPDIKVLLSSGYDKDEVVARFAGDRPNGCIQKPFRTADLVARVREILAG
jgi:PAS domain S-box-containing protein